jgi:putative SOS response-associated peptidase YedK
MCGRYALVDGLHVFMTFQVMKTMRAEGKVFELLPRYNASPMQTMPVVAVRGGALLVQPMRWWLVPHWSKDGKPVASTFNAKAETLGQSRLFSPYFKGSRCLVPADAFYEWQSAPAVKTIGGKSRAVVEKHPYAIRMDGEAPFMFAGLFSVWKNAQEEEFPSFTIITTEPNALMAPIHNRMPVILPEQHYERWLDREYRDAAALAKLLVPYPAHAMKAFPVTKRVSNSRNDEPACLVPAETP